jgi:cell division septum initiation protein DivIVA
MTTPRPKRATIVEKLRDRIADLEEQLSHERRRADELDAQAAFARRDLMDWMQRTAQRNGEIR